MKSDPLIEKMHEFVRTEVIFVLFVPTSLRGKCIALWCLRQFLEAKKVSQISHWNLGLCGDGNIVGYQFKYY